MLFSFNHNTVYCFVGLELFALWYITLALLLMSMDYICVKLNTTKTIIIIIIIIKAMTAAVMRKRLLCSYIAIYIDS